ncbi:MAG: hypothetical protein HFF76_12205, partial [Oscillospiraceae bacterium]|nr:hypothetical protein [Oscillospiraceae bacterium]
MNITIRPAAERDIPKLLELLTGICRLHQQGRPDLFRHFFPFLRKKKRFFILGSQTVIPFHPFFFFIMNL